jgi:hypothetical protein
VAWVEELCDIARVWTRDGASIRELFESAKPDLSDRDDFLTAVDARLRAHPELVDAWSGYAADKRTMPSPYLVVDEEEGSSEVGSLTQDGRRLDRRRYFDTAAACADFIYRESRHVLLDHNDN